MKPLSSKQLADMKDRSDDALSNFADNTDVYYSALDVPYLLAEIARLKSVEAAK